MRRRLLLSRPSRWSAGGGVVAGRPAPPRPRAARRARRRSRRRPPTKPRQRRRTTTTRPRPPAAAPATRTVRSAAARSSRPTTRGTATCRRCPVHANSANYLAAIPRSAATDPARRLRRRRRVRHPVHHRPGHASRSCRSTSSTTATRATPARTRSRSNAPIEGGERPHVLAVDRDRCKLYELFAASPGAPIAGRRHRARCSTCTSNALRPRGLDVGRRRGPADLRRPRALRRGGERPHRPRPPLHGVAHAARRTCTRPRTGRRRAPTRTCRRWGCGCGSRPSFDVSSYTGQARVILDGAEEVRDDRRRQRQQLVHHRRRRHALERRPT